MPLAFSGFDVDRDEAVRKEVIAWPVAAVVIAGWHFNGQVDEPELRVGAHLRPDAGVAVEFGRTLEPGLVAELSALRDGVEDPQPFAGASVVAADVPFHVAHGARVPPGPVRGADDDDVADDERRGVQAELGGVE